MRWFVSIGVALVSGALLVSDVAGRNAPEPPPMLADNQPTALPVDVELVLATDISYSMDLDELAIQREGYADALISQEFLQALKNGRYARIAITYFEWSSRNDQKLIIPWRLIDGPESAGAISNEIRSIPVRRGSRTSISGAIGFAMPLFESSGYNGQRRVIDISGDGPNNDGEPIAVLREAALQKGFVINGLPVMVKEPQYSTMDIENLDWYYEDCVIGGNGAFVVPIKGKDQFKEAIRTKLVLEVAGREPPPRAVPVSQKDPRISCTIGEEMWQRRWGR